MPGSSRRPGLQVAAAVVAAVVLLPIVVTVGRGAAVGWSEAVAYLVRPRIGMLLECPDVVISQYDDKGHFAGKCLALD